MFCRLLELMKPTSYLCTYVSIKLCSDFPTFPRRTDVFPFVGSCRGRIPFKVNLKCSTLKRKWPPHILIDKYLKLETAKCIQRNWRVSEISNSAPTERTNPTRSYLSVQKSVGPPFKCSCQSGALSVVVTVNSGGHKIRNVNVKMLRTLRSGWRHRARLPFRWYWKYSRYMIQRCARLTWLIKYI